MDVQILQKTIQQLGARMGQLQVDYSFAQARISQLEELVRTKEERIKELEKEN